MTPVSISIDSTQVLIYDPQDKVRLHALPASSEQDAVAQALGWIQRSKKKLKNRQTILLISPQNSQIKFIDLSAESLTPKGLEHQASQHTHLSPDKVATTAFIADERSLKSGSFVSAPVFQTRRQDLIELFSSLPPNVKILPKVFATPLTSESTLWLDVNSSTTTLVWTNENQIQGIKILEASGLDSIANTLGGENPYSRIWNSYNPVTADPAARTALNTWVQNVIQEIQTQTQSWETPHDTIMELTGYAPSFPPLLSALSKFSKIGTFEPEAVNLAHTAPKDRAQIIQLNTATTFEFNPVSFLNALPPESLLSEDSDYYAEVEPASESRRVFKLALLLAILVLVLPRAYEEIDLRVKQSNRDNLEQELTQSSDAFALAKDAAIISDFVTSTEAENIRFADVTNSIIQTAPEGTAILQLSATETDTSVVVLLNAKSPAPQDNPYQPMTLWITDLNTIFGSPQDMWSTSFSTENGQSTYTISFSISKDLVQGDQSE